ncbi:MAG: tetratricopeptide repeat protein [Dehalococcoidia bacterium]|nr:tetratricopeptide repeat protein [Dehalococcoidia bacterium]
MDSEVLSTRGSLKLKRDLSHEAVNLAVTGEWERATEVNKAILELFPTDVEAMNRLVKALIEMGSYVDAQAALNQVCEVAPYNSIAKKNRVRLDRLTANPELANPESSKQARKTVGASQTLPSQTFIQESGKSATTVIRNSNGKRTTAHLAPSDPVALSREKNTVMVKTLDGQQLGQLEPKMGNRLARLMDGGNKYSAVVVSVSDDGVSIMIRETFKHSSLQNMGSFPSQSASNSNGASRMLNNKPALSVQEEDDDDEDVLESSWSEDE